MAENTQHIIGRNRSPRVQITYDVEIGDAIEKQEIPFVVGIMADLSAFAANPVGQPDRKALKHPSRSFVEIDRDNFGDVMAKLAPSLPISGAIDAEGGDLDALPFTSLDDFSPTNLVKRIKPIAALYHQRSTLRDILAKLDSNDEFHHELKARVAAGTMGELGQVANSRLAALTGPATAAAAPATAEVASAAEPTP